MYYCLITNIATRRVALWTIVPGMGQFFLEEYSQEEFERTFALPEVGGKDG